MKNINLLKNLAVLSLLVLPTLSYSATQPAISISRANCYAPFPNMGDLNGPGYYTNLSAMTAYSKRIVYV